MASLPPSAVAEIARAAAAMMTREVIPPIRAAVIVYITADDAVAVLTSETGVQPTLTVLEQGIARVLEQGGLAGNYVT